MSSLSRRSLLTGLSGAAALAALAGCASKDGVAASSYSEDDEGGAGPGYVEGDGTYTEIAQDERGDVVKWSSTTMDGRGVSNDSYLGKVLVLNFWYAGCPPCRKEAPGMQEKYDELKPSGVEFLGVNIYDQKPTAQSYYDTFHVTYPTVLDVDDARVRLAFASSVPPKSVPATLVIDRQGRVAKRVIGGIESSVLGTLVTDVVKETA